ncbi:hypothetical protein TH66_19005 [Carbonactinospora thermoautotrophica]|uniref:Uncharacterized protein n=1 Tax=Carbonactinospora thermoautotrophica TaxID=1469144 RepID=A0A132MME1_9ACTN|nr:hypothetical protein [Carbonactinospora thermoautotrophica]KWW97642.1 hypothetical protein TH66_19005 [Carbonactinospora thermoautotrophica]KWW99026.1 hypothetical protein LI90_658 [Carbonactinospora thermoautotrophica]
MRYTAASLAGWVRRAGLIGLGAWLALPVVFAIGAVASPRGVSDQLGATAGAGLWAARAVNALSPKSADLGKAYAGSARVSAARTLLLDAGRGAKPVSGSPTRMLTPRVPDGVWRLVPAAATRPPGGGLRAPSGRAPPVLSSTAEIS